GFRFVGNAAIGSAVAVEELRRAYSVVVLAYGASTDRHLGVPGEDLEGSHAATAFVAWYNTHPDFVGEKFSLDTERAVVVGMGNVALDVARVLLRSPDDLAATDIADHALEALRKSRVREVVLLGRRGPAQAAFDQGELKDIVDLPNIAVSVEGDVSLEVPADADAAVRKNVELLRTLPREPPADAERRLRLLFLASPVELVGQGKRVVAIRYEDTELVDKGGSVSARGTGRTHELETGFVVRSIGYQGLPIPGVPFDAKKGVIPNEAGRVLGEDKRPLPGLYVTGWIKRGPSGLIGTNKACAKETTDQALADLATLPTPTGDPNALVARFTDAVGFDHWRAIDTHELEEGKTRGKVRHKIATVAAMLAAAKK
ncbi:MAG TPA: NADP oxidoreductase, partial [Polyangiaceae bacterium]